MKKAGLTLLGIGIVAFLVFLSWGFFGSDEFSLVLKIAVGAAGLGIIFLILSVIIKAIKQMQKNNEKKGKRIEL